MRKGNSSNFQYGADRWVSVHLALKLHNLQPFKPILFPKFFNFFTFILGAHSYYPRGPIMRNGNSSNFQYGPDRWVSVHLAFKLNNFQPFKPILFPKLFNLFTFILGIPFLLPQRANYEKWEFLQLPILL